MREARYLAELGEIVLANGYPVIPIQPGAKRPGFDGWQNTHTTPQLIRKWVGNGHAKDGVGILSATVPGVDLDIQDGELARYMQRWVIRNIGPAPLRIGQYPKRLLPFRSDDPFRKVQSRRFRDADGRISKVEILGDGQQFVSHHIHPDTGNPYTWADKRGPATIPRVDLTPISPEQAAAIVAEYERQAESRGWVLVRAAKLPDKPSRTALPAPSPKAAAAVEDSEDWSRGIDLKGPVDISVDELRAKLLLIPAFEDYGSWLEICAALHHQFQDDPDTGLELFVDYSSRCSNFDENECIEKWNSFRRSDDANAKTARYILALAKDAEKEAAVEQRAEVEALLADARSEDDMLAACTMAKHAAFDPYTRNIVAGKLREAYKRITGLTLNIRQSRDMIRFEDPDRKTTPRWLESWCYLTDDSTFYHHPTGTTMARQAFNDAHLRLMLSKRDVLEGRIHAEILPAEAALNQYQIPCVRNRMYMPDQDEFFTVNGVPYVNTYTDRSVPEEPETYSRTEAQDVEIVRAHFTHLFGIERDREILISFFAYIVQTRKRPNFAAMIQGCEGDGKSFFYYMMAAILGPENVGMLSGDLLQDLYTSWAEGRLLNVIEEVRWLGHNRHDILNRIKPYLTNQAVQVRRMHRDAYTVPNCTAYLLLTNHRDALPLGGNDSRYFIANSNWQDRGELLAFMEKHPDYYPNLYRAIERSPGAIRKWFMGYALHPEFNPAARAPASSGQRYMVAIGKSDEVEAVEEVLAESKARDLSPVLLNATKLADAMADMANGVVPLTRAMNRILSDMGFTYLGRFRADGEKARFWSKKPERFGQDSEMVGPMIRDYLSDDL